jgi:nicotine blue oxidoreductase
MTGQRDRGSAVQRGGGPADSRGGGFALILAAGSGRRLGLGPKALLPWGDSVFVVRAVKAAREAGLRVIVTAGPQFDAIAAHLAEAGLEEPMVTLVEVPDASIGMSASFRTGVAAVAGFAGPDTEAAGVQVPKYAQAGAATSASNTRDGTVPDEIAVTMMLVDQPWVGAEVLTRLNSLFDATRDDPPRVVRAAWSGAPGHPVVMSLRHAQDAAAGATGDEAGRTWMRNYRHLIDAVECADLGSGADIDTPADLATAVAGASASRSPHSALSSPVPELGCPAQGVPKQT